MSEIGQRVGQTAIVTQLAKQREAPLQERHRFGVVTLLALDPRPGAERNGHAALVPGGFIQRVRLAEAGQRAGDIVTVLRHQSQIADRRRHSGRVAHLAPQRQALLEPHFSLIVVALDTGQDSGRVQRLRSHGR